MPCPYADRKGPVVICRVTGRKMNPLAAPCLTSRYLKCRYYLRATQEKEKPKPAGKPVKEEAATAGKPPQSSASTPPEKPVRGEVKGITATGGKPQHCGECIYYSSAAKMCLLLKIPVPDPLDPPCTRAS